MTGLLAIGGSAEAYATNSGEVVINEVAWMGTAASPSDEWIELYNTTNQAVDLTGWTLKSTTDGSPTFIFNTTDCNNVFIAPNDHFLLERTDDTTVSDITADCIYTGNLSNSGESLSLEDPSHNVIDTANGNGGSWPAGVNATKSTMERIDALASDTDANWATNDGIHRNGLDAKGAPLNGTPKAQNSTVNLPPTASTGPDQTVSEGDAVTLDGSASADPDGDPLSFSWVQTLGSTVTLSGADTMHPNFTAPQVGPGGALLTFQLTVDDGRGGTDSDNVNITVNDVALPPSVKLSGGNGDANSDDQINVIDARICLQIALRFIQATDTQINACDVTGDGQVTQADAEKIAQFAIGQIDSLATRGQRHLGFLAYPVAIPGCGSLA
ncbi:MAG TPA: hypothetical protein ENI60_01875 [Candidatus Fraserbacteria bacterium]|nr:hypothetical protein [Candidatus Fraserbacteria bacterium]